MYVHIHTLSPLPSLAPSAHPAVYPHIHIL